MYYLLELIKIITLKFLNIKNFIIDSFKYDILLVVTLVQPLLLISSFLAIFFLKEKSS